MFLIVMLRSLTLTTKIKSALTPRSPRAEWTMISWGTSKPNSNFHSTAQETVVCWTTHSCSQAASSGSSSHCSQQSSLSRGSNQKLDLLSTFIGFLVVFLGFFLTVLILLYSKIYLDFNTCKSHGKAPLKDRSFIFAYKQERNNYPYEHLNPGSLKGQTPSWLILEAQKVVCILNPGLSHKTEFTPTTSVLQFREWIMFPLDNWTICQHIQFWNYIWKGT